MAISLKPEYLKRYKDIALLLWKYGRDDIVTQSGLSGSLHIDERAKVTGGKPEELAHDLEQMGPLYVKLGQLLSSRPDLLPLPYVQALSRLQDRLAPFSFGEVERIVEEELHARISKAFTSFESTPIASASLGQVHRATLRDGRAVAVKVQRPAVREEVAKDLDLLRDVAEFLDAHTEIGQEYRFRDILDEFQHTLALELDYRREAQHLIEIGNNIREFERIIIPHPIPDYTTERVLTMDYVRGRKITALSPLARLTLDGKLLAEQLFRAYLKQILVDGIFHADPHPGNIFITDDQSIALIDLGMVGHLRASLQEQLLKLLLAISEHRSDDVTAIGLIMGERGKLFKQDQHQTTLYHKVDTMLADRLDGTLERTQIGLAVMDFIHICGDAHIHMPAELTMLGKTLLNLDEIGRTLDPEFDPNAAIRHEAAKLARERLRKSVTPVALLSAALEAKEFAQELPRRVNTILDRAANNQLTFHVDAIEEQTLIDGFQKIANRIATGLILAALIVGAAMLMRVETAFRILGYPGLAMLCFIGAAFGGLWLIIEIALHDRRIQKH
jgi:predicted unusual protein kinase regulating ubiquinone biosynthesis (AarF/ABC1/UbiB family)